jgi:hypothetical protein
MMRAMDRLGALTDGCVDAGGDWIIGATKVERRKQKGQQSRECEALRDRAPPSLRQAASDRGQGHVAPPKAMQSAHTQFGRSEFVNNLDELFGYDRVRAARKTKRSRAALISAAPRHRVRFRRAS